MVIKEKCKNHKKLHQFHSKISVHLKRSYNYTPMKKGPSPRGSHEHKRNSVVKYYTINFTINILMYQEGKPEAENVL